MLIAPGNVIAKAHEVNSWSGDGANPPGRVRRRKKMGDEFGSEYGGIDDAMIEQALRDAEDRMNENARRRIVKEKENGSI